LSIWNSPSMSPW